jgi:hypothetical protein
MRFDYAPLLMVAALVSVVTLIVWLGIRSDDAKISGCREAGGSMIGDVCIIRVRSAEGKGEGL